MNPLGRGEASASTGAKEKADQEQMGRLKGLLEIIAETWFHFSFGVRHQLLY